RAATERCRTCIKLRSVQRRREPAPVPRRDGVVRAEIAEERDGRGGCMPPLVVVVRLRDPLEQELEGALEVVRGERGGDAGKLARLLELGPDALLRRRRGELVEERRHRRRRPDADE